MQSDQSTWASSPGAVSIGIDDPTPALKRGPRSSRRKRVTVAYDPVKPSATNRSYTDVPNNLGLTAKIASIRAFHASSITRTCADTTRAAGGPPSLSQRRTVAG